MTAPRVGLLAERRRISDDEATCIRITLHGYGSDLIKCKTPADLMRLDKATVREIALLLGLEAPK